MAPAAGEQVRLLPHTMREIGVYGDRAALVSSRWEGVPGSMIVMGAKDETIAGQLGVSLRTVRRRISELMDEVGATTRFQAGREAARRGLL